MPTLFTYEGNDIIIGTLESDTIIGSNGFDSVNGLLGYDTLDMSALTSGVAITHTADQAIQITHANGQTIATNVEAFIGTDFNDFIALSGLDVVSERFTFYLEGGDDVMTTGQGDTDVHGGDGDDLITGNIGDDYLWGNNGDDTMSGEAGADALRGGFGDDVLYGGAGDDLVTGNIDDDILYGGDGDDMLDGGTQDDVLYGGNGDDTLFGSRGHDTIDGGAGNDLLYGDRPGEEEDIFNDTFVFANDFGQDVIMDFDNGMDLVDFSGNDTFNNFADVLASASDDGTHLTITLDAQNTLVIENFTLADMDASDFVF